MTLRGRRVGNTPQQQEERSQEHMGNKNEDSNTSLLQILIVPLLSLASMYFLGGYITSWAVVVGLVVAAYHSFMNQASPDLFMSSGRTPPATFAQELILKRKGGKGSAYFSDPSLAFGELSNFTYTKGRRISFRELVEDKWDVIGPYCVDDETRTVVLVETPPGVDPATEGPFYFQTQRDNAIKVYTVPYDEYISVIESLPNTHTDNVLLVYNTARCGSTLLSQCLDQVSGFQSISEPDALTSLTHIASEAHDTRDEDLTNLARANIKLLAHLRRRHFPERDGLCIKFRFQMVYVADILAKAVPDAKAVFLYRNGLDVVDSMGAAFINTGPYKVIRAIGLDVLYVFHASTLLLHLWKLMPLIKDTDRFPQKCYKSLGAVSPFVFSWMSVMTYAMEARQCGLLHALVRYEELVQGKTEYVVKMLHACGLRANSDQEGTPVVSPALFSSDVHTGVTRSSRTSYDDNGKVRRKGYTYLQPHEADMVKAVFARHGVIQGPNYIIPGTLMA